MSRNPEQRDNEWVNALVRACPEFSKVVETIGWGDPQAACTWMAAAARAEGRRAGLEDVIKMIREVEPRSATIDDPVSTALDRLALQIHAMIKEAPHA